ncbi:hypothetical protein [Streptomyces angustmyceticus]|uniref:hypothetical protein n=1 Tax=Streptomyces angustmyceticus TaxID=285578 RepID=UPI0037F2997E
MNWGISLHFRRNAIAVATAAMLGLGGVAGTAHAETTAASAPTASTSSNMARHAGDVRIQGNRWHVKNAMSTGSVGPKPSRTVVCQWVVSDGGKKTHGEACFDPASDYFWVKDTLADGMSIYMRALYTGDTQIFDCRDFKGKTGWTACYFDREMPEGKSFNFAVLAYKGNNLKYKSPTATARS